MLYQLSYSPRPDQCTRGAGYSQPVAQRRPRSSLGALFLFLAAIFAGGAFASASSNSGSTAHWIVAVCAGVIALWFVGLCVRAFRPR
jgi:apolipoprotein N-acyltransferase